MTTKNIKTLTIHCEKSNFGKPTRKRLSKDTKKQKWKQQKRKNEKKKQQTIDQWYTNWLLPNIYYEYLAFFLFVL